MKSWKRITLVIFVLIGGTISFGYWSFQQFDNAFDYAFENLSASYIAISPHAPELPLATATTTPVTATSTPTTSEASSTASSDQDDIDPKFQLIFSPKKNGVYIGCTYEISWLASTSIKSLETALIDAGTKETVGPKTSGLAKENTIEKESQNLNWKVGFVWPGKYFISISNVNGVATDERSQKFIINKMPNGSDKKEQKNLCEETGGNLF